MAEEQFKSEIERLLAENAALQQLLRQERKVEACAVSVKMPPFWTDKPAVWFAQVEAQFAIAGITSDTTMFNYVISQLDQRLAGEIDDIITKPPKSGKYLKLKEELIQRLSMSQEQRVRQLISEEELGDRRPSQFLRHLRSLAGTALSDESILRSLWMRRLPQQVQAILASQAELGLDKTADLADKIIELVGPRSQVFSVSTPGPSSSVVASLTNEIADLKKQIAALSTKGFRGRSRDRSMSSNRRSRGNTPSRTKVCWYHKKFDAKATKCIKPCAWTPAQGNITNNQ